MDHLNAIQQLLWGIQEHAGHVDYDGLLVEVLAFASTLVDAIMCLDCLKNPHMIIR